jgi:hypothetical protein
MSELRRYSLHLLRSFPLTFSILVIAFQSLKRMNRNERKETEDSCHDGTDHERNDHKAKNKQEKKYLYSTTMLGAGLCEFGQQECPANVRWSRQRTAPNKTRVALPGENPAAGPGQKKGERKSRSMRMTQAREGMRIN